MKYTNKFDCLVHEKVFIHEVRRLDVQSDSIRATG